MKLSENTGELFTAFAKFQGELENASKGKQGHGYKYATLAECINTAKPILASNGLAVSQMLGTNEQGQRTLITMLSHASGQYMSSEFVMVDAVLMGGAGKNPAQVLGSAITYQRRYSYAAIIGMAQEDDDGKGLTGKTNQQQNNNQQGLNQQQIGALQALIESKGYTVQDACKESFKVNSLAEILNFNKAMAFVESWTPSIK